MCTDSKSTKKTDNLTVFFALLRFDFVKAVPKMYVGEIDTKKIHKFDFLTKQDDFKTDCLSK